MQSTSAIHEPEPSVIEIVYFFASTHDSYIEAGITVEIGYLDMIQHPVYEENTFYDTTSWRLHAYDQLVQCMSFK